MYKEAPHMFQSILQETLAEENWQEVQKLGSRNIPALFPWELSRSTVRIFLWEPIFTGAAECAESSGIS